MSESENETSLGLTPLPREEYVRRRMLVGLGVVAVFMAVVLAVQAVSSDSRPSDARSSVE